MPKIKLISYPDNYIYILKLACSKPYGKDVSVKGIQNIITSGHLSILEHIYIVMEIECSVAVLGQLTRHRHFSFTCQSARGKEFDTFIEPIEFKEYPLKNTSAGMCYQDALGECMSYQDARYYLPQGVKTSIVMSGNARSWYEYLPKRLCKRAMPEHKALAELIYAELKAAMPEIFNRAFMNCDRCTEAKCTFR